MISKNRITRRDFIKLVGIGAGTVTLSACRLIPSVSSDPATVPATSTPLIPTPVSPALTVDLTAMPATIPIFPGRETSVWRYQASVREGSADLVQTLNGSYLGPIFRVRKDQRVQIRLNNELPDRTTVHWHGLRIPEDMDGHPRDAVGPGKSYQYDFQVINRAGTYWFHPHPHGLTGPQVYYGLAGLLIISDEEETALGLPSGEYDLSWVIQDRTLDSQNQMVYLTNGMMDQMLGFLGDTILVNGTPNATLDIKASAYRLRLLNGSNSRIYKLAWQDHTPLTVIATDGGLLEAPVARDYITLAPGERVELWADFSKQTAGSEMQLVSLPFTGFSGGGMGMMQGGMMGSSSLPQGASFQVLNLKIGEKGVDVTGLPPRLSTIEHHRVDEAVNRNSPRSFVLAMQGMIHTMNDRVFEMDAIARDEIVNLGELELWEFINRGASGSGMGMGMMNMALPHPMHIHGVQFQVIGRQIARGFEAAYRELSAGFVDEGWKDTVLIMPGEKVQLLIRFENYMGTFLYHCHNLEHEDAGMMRNYRIES